MTHSLRSLIAGIGLATRLVVASPTPVMADTPPPSRIGVIDLERTLSETPFGKRAAEELDRSRKTKQAGLDTRQKDLAKKAAELDKQAAVLKPDVLAQMKTVLEGEYRELQQLYTRLERDLAVDQAKMRQIVLAKARPIIAELATQNGFDLVLDRSTVVWAVPTTDLTDKVNARMK